MQVNGLFLRIRAVLNHLQKENMLLELEHLADIESEKDLNIELDDGLVFKEIATEKLFQFNFMVMDPNGHGHDLISPLFWNTDSDGAFEIPNSILFQNYIKTDSLLVKLIILF